MALILVPGIVEGKLEVYTKPPGDEDEPSHVFYVTSDEYPTLLATDRVGSWINVHTRNISGWVHAVDMLPSGLPCSCVVNDELPVEAQIRVRETPDDNGEVVTALRPGDRIEVVGVQEDWYNIRFNSVEAWLRRYSGNTALALPLIPRLYCKHSSLQFGCSLRIRSDPSANAPIIGLTAEQFILGIEADEEWVRILREGATTVEWMQLVTEAKVKLLEPCQFQQTMLMCISDSLPNEASLRVRQNPSTTSEVVHVVQYDDLIAVSEIVEGWAHVVSGGALGWVLTIQNGTTILQPHKLKGSSVSPTRKSRLSFGVTKNPTTQKILQSPALPEEAVSEKADGATSDQQENTRDHLPEVLNIQDDITAESAPKVDSAANGVEMEIPVVSKTNEEKPLPVRTNCWDEQPIGGGKKIPTTEAAAVADSLIDPTIKVEENETPSGLNKVLPQALKAPFDEQPIHSATNMEEKQLPLRKNSWDEQPIGGSRNDPPVETPIEQDPEMDSTKLNQEKENNVQALQSTSSLSFDEQPIHGAASKTTVEVEKPIEDTKKSSTAPSDQNTNEIPVNRASSFDEKVLPTVQHGNTNFVELQLAFATAGVAENEQGGAFAGTATSLLSFDSAEQMAGLKHFITLLDGATDADEAAVIVSGLWIGLSSCLQDANSDVSEEALRVVHIICGRHVPFSKFSVSLLDLLVHKMYSSKQSSTVNTATLCTQLILGDYLEECLPVLLKGTTSRNLATALQSLLCISKCLGEEIEVDNLSTDLLSSMIDQLLRVIATAKVRLTCLVLFFFLFLDFSQSYARRH